MSTEHNFTRGSDQYNWIYNDLKGVDRDVTPWLFVLGHRPMYVDSKYSPGTRDGIPPVAAMLQKDYDVMFLEHKVDLAFWGHTHGIDLCSCF